MLTLIFFVLMQVGAGPSNWVERVALVPLPDEGDDEEVLPMDMGAISKGCYHWVVAEFSISTSSRHFGQVNDYLTPFFETLSQYRLYRGVICNTLGVIP